jgi:hypothetical protein
MPADAGALLSCLFRVVAEGCFSRREFLPRILEDGRFPSLHALFTKRMAFEVGRLVEKLEREGRASRATGKADRVVFLSSAYFGSLLYWIRSGTPGEIDSFCCAMADCTMAVLVGKRAPASGRRQDGRPLHPRARKLSASPTHADRNTR